MSSSESTLKARAKQIFLEALDQPESGRHEWVRKTSGGEPELLREVESLLQYHAADPDGSFLAQPASQVLDIKATRPLAPGTRLEQYELGEVIGEGGMGVVYRARQLTPFVRDVAIKMVKPGLHSETSLARFESERETMNLLDHPGVAKIYDAGIAENGLPYFVMELVRGTPLDEYCRREKPPVESRIELVLEVARAVHHAHMRGVLHRDLKPSNILVESIDDRPSPKVIDFGVAKALNLDGDHTRHGEAIGTPSYMSPEQSGGARGAATSDVDVRADVYSLGVILYQLVTGNLPYEPEARGPLGFPDFERGPLRPSTRVDDDVTDPSGVRRILRNELDWLILKAIDPDRARRYRSMADFSEDLERYLDNRPLVARPPSLLYQLRKFCRRRQGIALASCTAVLAVALGVVALLYHSVTVSRHLKTIDLAREKAESEEKIARAERENAMHQMEIAKRAQLASEGVLRFLEIEVFRRAEPGQAKPMESVQALLKQVTVDRVEAQVKDPLLQARINEAVGRLQSEWDLASQALEHFGRAFEAYRSLFGEESTEAKRVVARRVQLHYGVERQPQLVDELSRYLDFERLPERLDLRDEAERVDAELWHLYAGLCELPQSIDEREKAYRVRRALVEAVERGTREPMREGAKYMARLPLASVAAGRYAEAIESGERFLETYRDPFYETLHVEVYYALGQAASRIDELRKAREYARKSVMCCERLYGENHRRTLIAMTIAGTISARADDGAGALELLTTAHDRALKVFGTASGMTLNTAIPLHRELKRQGRTSEATELALRLFRATEKRADASPIHWMILFEFLAKDRRETEAAVCLVRATKRLGSDLSQPFPDALSAARQLGAESQDLLEEAVVARISNRIELGVLLVALEKREQSELAGELLMTIVAPRLSEEESAELSAILRQLGSTLGPAVSP